MKKITVLLSFLFSATFYGQSVTTYAGSSQGYSDGTSLAAQFYSPFDVCVSAQGMVYVTDQNNTIRAITLSGMVTTFAGSTDDGYVDGPGNLARFYTPNSICIDTNGNVYVADYNNNKIRKISPNGVVSTLAGTTQGYQDGAGTSAQFNLPQGVCVDATGNVYVADAENNMIRKITPQGVVSTLAGQFAEGFADGNGAAAQFNFPTRLCVDQFGYVYVTDTMNQKIRKISPTGMVTTLAGSTAGFANGVGTAAKFYYPMGICVDASQNLYVADGVNNKIRKITSNGTVSTYAGGVQGYQNGPSGEALFFQPTGVCVSADGTLYVTDRNNYKIRKISAALGTESYNGEQNAIKIYPNPAKELIHIDVAHLSNESRMIITDLSGKTILDQKVSNAQTLIDVSKYSKGIYFVTLYGNGEQQTQKVIVE